MMSVLHPKKILIAVTDTRAAFRISQTLQLSGFVPRAAENLNECVKTAGIFLPDVVLMDVDNHQRSSYAAAIKLRKIVGLERLHLVALTACADSEILANMAKAGFDELLPRLSGPDRVMLSCR